MEPVVFPRPIMNVNRTERVTRAKKASDQRGQERAFHRHLRPPGTEAEPPEEPGTAPEETAGADSPADPRPEAAPAPAPKLINIRV
ncbi:MAG: hypothetical protein EHM15_00710 [Desulfobacteraceae bacterium]|nr:MAG: hypothetical protein EHM15_00710 [Desulfobacteraceae bacterium]